MTKLVNRAKMTTASTGTGSPITLGSAVDGYQTFAAAGVANGEVVRYVIEDGDAWEIGLGTYTASGTTLTRSSIESSNADNPLNLTGNAVVYVSAAAADLQELVDFADNFVLPTSDGSTGQVLQTNGAGTLSFTTISSYTDADVDTHLNTGTASSGEVLSWTGSDYDWIAVSAGATDIDGLSDGYSDGSSVGLGPNALLNDDGTANGNTALGQNAGDLLTSGANNVHIGAGADARSATDTQSVVIGSFAKATSQSISIGYGSMNGSDGSFNMGVGYQAAQNVSGSNNIGLGRNSLRGDPTAKLTGTDNIGIGYQTGYDLSTGAYNFLAGYQAGTNITTGSNNVAIGNGALDAATTGGRNIAIGQDAMGLGVATAASGDNIAVGYGAGAAITSGRYNLFLGMEAGDSVTTGRNNIGIGWRPMATASNGNYNIGIGAFNLLSTTGASNVAIGEDAMQFTTTGAYNVCIGRKAGEDITTGQYNVVIGDYAGETGLTTGSNNIILGVNSDPSSTSVSNEITLGNSSITNLRVPGVGFQFDTTDGLIVPKTVTAGGTTGAQTINKTAGTVNFAAAATSLVVTNSFVDTNSIIIATVGTDDVTMKSVAVVAAAGSFTLYANAAATAETRVNWFVAN